MYYCLVLALIPFQLKAQNISNPSFEEYYIGAIDRVFEWITSDGFRFASGQVADTIYPLEASTVYDAQGFLFSEMLTGVNLGYDSPFSNTAIRLKTQPQALQTDGSNYPTFLTNGTHLNTQEDGYIDFSQGGVPFPHRPTAITGYYRLIDTLSAIDHFGHCRILLKRFNAATQTSDTIAYTDSQMDLTPTVDWQAFSIPINYRSADTPDSLVLVFNPSIFPDQPAELWLDELDFDYTTSTSIREVGSGTPTIYPNPVKDYINIAPHQEKYNSFRLLDVSGRVLLEGPFQRRIDIRRFNQQVFILQVFPASGKPKTYSVLRQGE